MNRNSFNHSLFAGLLVTLVLFMSGNLVKHQAEAMYLSGWLKTLAGDFDGAARMFERTKYVAQGKSETVFDYANVAMGAALTLSWQYDEAMGVLMRESNGTSGQDSLDLNSKRLLALGNARARNALEQENEELRRLGIKSAMSAYTGSYRMNRDPDSAANYAALEALLKREESQAEKRDGQSGSGSEKPEPPKNEGDSGKRENDPPKPEEGKKPDAGAGMDGKDAGTPPSSPSPSPQPQPDAPKNPPPNAPGSWSSGGSMRSLRGDPGSARASDGTIPLSDAERKELENGLGELADLQKERGRFVRPDGQPDDRNGMPNSLRDIFSGDPMFQGLIPDQETGKNGKTW